MEESNSRRRVDTQVMLVVQHCRDLGILGTCHQIGHTHILECSHQVISSNNNRTVSSITPRMPSLDKGHQLNRINSIDPRIIRHWDSDNKGPQLHSQSQDHQQDNKCRRKIQNQRREGILILQIATSCLQLFRHLIILDYLRSSSILLT